MRNSPQRTCTESSTSRLPPRKYTPVIWEQETRDNIFTQVVKNFAMKYTSRDDAQHLTDTLKTKYQISEY